MIESIKISNFQSHKRSILTFHKGVNVIVGQSDKGKTAVIRALRWAATNKPTGEAIRSNWGGDTEVIVTTKEGVVTRKKTDTKNIYMVDDVLLKAFGQGVPKEVSDVLNLEEVNLQQQMDAPFLLSKSSGEVAAFFNKVANIDVIDRAVSNAKKEISDVNQTINHAKNDLKQKQEDLESYKNLHLIEQKLKQLDVLEGNRKRLTTGRKDIDTALIRIKEIDAVIDEMEDLLKDSPKVQALLKKNELLIEKKQNLRKLNQLLITELNLGKQIAENNILVNLSGVVNALITKVENLQQSRSNLTSLRALVFKHTSLTQKIGKLEENVQELEVQLPNVCPVCGGTGKLKNHKH